MRKRIFSKNKTNASTILSQFILRRCAENFFSIAIYFRGCPLKFRNEERRRGKGMGRCNPEGKLNSLMLHITCFEIYESTQG